MIVVVTVAKGNGSKSNIFGFCSDCNSSSGKEISEEQKMEKLKGIGSVMENYVGCDRSCNSDNLG